MAPREPRPRRDRPSRRGVPLIAVLLSLLLVMGLGLLLLHRAPRI